MFRKPNWKKGDTFTVIQPFYYNEGKELRQVKKGEVGKILSFYDFGNKHSMVMTVEIGKRGEIILQDDSNIAGDGVNGSTVHCE